MSLAVTRRPGMMFVAATRTCRSGEATCIRRRSTSASSYLSHQYLSPTSVGGMQTTNTDMQNCRDKRPRAREDEERALQTCKDLNKAPSAARAFSHACSIQPESPLSSHSCQYSYTPRRRQVC